MKLWHLVIIAILIASAVFVAGWWFGTLLHAEASRIINSPGADIVPNNLWEPIPYSPQPYWTLEQAREHVTLPDGEYFTLWFTDTGSMKPTLNEHSMGIFVRGSDAQIGDVVAFSWPNGMNVTHRIVGERDGQWVTKGDATTIEDPELLPKDAVQGRLVAIFY